ncbi:MAG: hypothetical protein PHY47_11395 [Lachnospiraceae bacterium]|nr:hypothetical protein [Lachnospiraceae bacterium]
MKYYIYRCDGSRNAVVMIDTDGKEIVIDCEKAEAILYLISRSMLVI